MRSGLVKLGGGLLIFLSILGFGLLPLKWRAFRRSPRLVSVSNCFSGGLFLAIGLIHVLPEAAELLERNKNRAPAPGRAVFPLSYLICLLCFSAVLLVDKVLVNPTDAAPSECLDLRQSFMNPAAEESSEPEDNFKELISARYRLAVQAIHRRSVTSRPEPEDVGTLFARRRFGGSLADEGAEEEGAARPLIGRAREAAARPAHHHHVELSSKSPLAAYLLLMALGIHSVFAGLAFGVASSEREVVGMFVAMIAHKWSEALSVGVSFSGSDVPQRKAVLLIFFLASLTPLGILIGWLLSASSDLVTGVCMALSAGTFLYISCTEIIIEEFAIGRHKGAKIAAYTAGILLVILMNWAE